MTTVALHPAPRWRVVASEQVRAVGLHIRAAGFLFIGALMLFGGIAIRYAASVSPTVVHRGGMTSFAYTPEISVIVTYYALLVPVLLWHDERPSKRVYHRAMPIPGSSHALTRVLAGWVWVMVATAVFVVFVVVNDELTRRVAGLPFNSYPQIAAWQWLVPFTSASIAYTISSVAAVGTESPVVWVVGVPVLYAGVAIAPSMFGASHVAEGMLKLFSGYVGAGAAMAGTLNGAGVAGRLIEPSATRWIEATVVWGTVAGALLYAVSRRRPAA